MPNLNLHRAEVPHSHLIHMLDANNEPMSHKGLQLLRSQLTKKLITFETEFSDDVFNPPPVTPETDASDRASGPHLSPQIL